MAPEARTVRSEPRVRAALAPAAWAAVVVASLVILDWSASSTVAVDRPWTLRGWAEILAEGGPVVLAMAGGRLLALALAWYLVVLAGLAVLARGLRLVALERVGISLTVAPLRRALWGATALVMMAGAAGTVVGGGGAPAAAIASAADPSADPPTPSGPAPTLTMRLIDPAEPAPAEPAPAEPEPAPAPAEEPHREVWTVECGESFWLKAERTLGAAWGRQPTDAEVVNYWRELIASNRGSLVDRANPDLIYPGQLFGVPQAPPPP